MPNTPFAFNLAINTTYQPLAAAKSVVALVNMQCTTAWILRINGGADVNVGAGATWTMAHVDLATIEVKHGTTGTLNVHGYAGRGASEGY